MWAQLIKMRLKREDDRRRQERLSTARARMAEIFEGPPEFVDLTVVDELSE